MSSRVTLEGSERTHPQGTQDAGPVAGGDHVEVTVYLRRDPRGQPFDAAAEARKPLAQRRYLTPTEAAGTYGAAADDVEAVRAFAAAHDLDVLAVNQAGRSVKLAGTAAAIGGAFGVQLRHFAGPGQRYRSHAGSVELPSELDGIVTAVFGLDNRRLGRPFLRRTRNDQLQNAINWFANGPHPIRAETQPDATYLPPQVASLYDFPSQDASSLTVGVFAFNGSLGDGTSAPGGYDATTLDDYFSSQLDLPSPKITTVTVQGPGNDPGDGSDQNDSSPEIYLDLSMLGSLAGGASIVLYFTEFTEQGWVDAVTTAATDTTNDPSVISISYGNPEDGSDSAWTSAAITQVNSAFEQAASQGKTFTCAAGDSGASDGESTGLHVDFPASSPWVLACGGTRLESSGVTITAETVWNDQSDGNGATGGGVSTVFTPAPAWQTSADVAATPGTALGGRGVPDVASLADPDTPFIVAQPGGPSGVGGTSAAAPLWASLLTLCNAALGTRVGYLNPLLYALPAGTVRDIVSGDNAAPGGEGYDAGPGWDACTGWGSPGGSTLLAALKSPPATTS
jgi:kumamolisin